MATEMTTVPAVGQTITSIERAADVLTLFADTRGPTLGVTEIANALGLSKAVVYRILTSFRSKGFIEIDPGTRRYSLGPRALHIGLSYLRGTDVPAMARPEMVALSRETEETATLSLRTGYTRVYVDQITPDRDVKMVIQVGLQVPLHAGASSKAFLAFLDDDDIDEYLKQPLPALTASTVTSVRALKTELLEIRDRGYADSIGERLDGAASVAAPILDHASRPVAVISVCGPAERYAAKKADCAEKLLAATGRLSARLGHRPA